MQKYPEYIRPWVETTPVTQWHRENGSMLVCFWLFLIFYHILYHLFDLCLLNVVGGEFMEQLDFLFPRNGKQPDFSPSQTATHKQKLKIFALAFKILCYLKKERF